MINRRPLAAAITTLLLLAASACSASNSNAFVGTWDLYDGIGESSFIDGSYILHDDGTGTYTYQGLSTNGTWKVDGDKFTFTGGGIGGTFDYDIIEQNDDTIRMASLANGEPSDFITTLVRAGNAPATGIDVNDALTQPGVTTAPDVEADPEPDELDQPDPTTATTSTEPTSTTRRPSLWYNIRQPIRWSQNAGWEYAWWPNQLPVMSLDFWPNTRDYPPGKTGVEHLVSVGTAPVQLDNYPDTEGRNPPDIERPRLTAVWLIPYGLDDDLYWPTSGGPCGLVGPSTDPDPRDWPVWQRAGIDLGEVAFACNLDIVGQQTAWGTQPTADTRFTDNGTTYLRAVPFDEEAAERYMDAVDDENPPVLIINLTPSYPNPCHVIAWPSGRDPVLYQETDIRGGSNSSTCRFID